MPPVATLGIPSNADVTVAPFGVVTLACGACTLGAAPVFAACSLLVSRRTLTDRAVAFADPDFLIWSACRAPGAACVVAALARGAA
jgi:hypothetical protein